MPDPQTPMAAVRADLQGAVAALYAAFSAHPAPVSLVAAPMRDAAEILADLRSAPLAKLSVEALAPYAFWAVTTVGTEADYRHFLPRILELATRQAADPGFEPCIIASRLALAGWRDWPDAERAAVVDLLRAAWACNRLQDIEIRAKAWHWLRAMAMLDLPVTPCLDLWLQQPAPEAMLQLAQGEREIKPLLRGNGYWEDVSPQHRQAVLDWLAGEAVEAALVETIGDIPDRHRWQVEAMLDAIADLREAR